MEPDTALNWAKSSDLGSTECVPYVLYKEIIMCCLWISEPVHRCAVLRPHPCHPVTRWQRPRHRLHQWKLRGWVRWLAHLVIYFFYITLFTSVADQWRFWYGFGAADPYLWLTDPDSKQYLGIKVFLTTYSWWYKDPDLRYGSGSVRCKNIRIRNTAITIQEPL